MRARCGSYYYEGYAFNNDEHMREIDAVIERVGQLTLRMKDIQVVTRNSAHDLRPVRFNFGFKSIN
jgi:hypothetical protein